MRIETDENKEWLIIKEEPEIPGYIMATIFVCAISSFFAGIIFYRVFDVFGEL